MSNSFFAKYIGITLYCEQNHYKVAEEAYPFPHNSWFSKTFSVTCDETVSKTESKSFVIFAWFLLWDSIKEATVFYTVCISSYLTDEALWYIHKYFLTIVALYLMSSD